MPDKYYVLPVDAAGMGYFPIKAWSNPWDDQGGTTFCANCPQFFGGTDEHNEGMFPTLWREASEESHHKIQLMAPQANAPATYHLLHQHGVMSFYAGTDFTYEPNAYCPSVLLRRPEYRETTGEVLRVQLAQLPATNKGEVARYLLALYERYIGGPLPPGTQAAQFLTSEVAQAFLEAGNFVRARQQQNHPLLIP